MQDFPSKAHYCYKSHIFQMTTPHSIDNLPPYCPLPPPHPPTPPFLQGNFEPPIYDFSKISTRSHQPHTNKGLLHYSASKVGF